MGFGGAWWGGGGRLLDSVGGCRGLIGAVGLFWGLMGTVEGCRGCWGGGGGCSGVLGLARVRISASVCQAVCRVCLVRPPHAAHGDARNRFGSMSEGSIYLSICLSVFIC